MMPTTTNDPPSVLQYADVATRWGVAAQTQNGVTRVIVPPLPGWRYLSKWFYIGGALLAVMLCVFSVGAIRRPDPAAIPALAFFACPLFVVLLMAFYRLHRRLIVEVDDRSVTVRRSHNLLVSARTWPRQRVTEARINRSNGNLLLRIAGQELVNVFVSPSPEVTEWVAQTVENALRGTPRAPSSPARQSNNLPSGASRIALIALGLVMCAGGITLLFWDIPWKLLGVYVLVFAAAPFGIAMGTQDKEFYL